MDQERFVTIEEMEAATASLLENGKKVGADSWQQRVKNQTPHCGFGEAGTCCRICAMGPCRITPKSPRGICGCDVHGIVGRNFLKFTAGGSATHSDHGREIMHTLHQTKEGGNYQVKDPEKLIRIAHEWGVETEGKDIYELAHEMAEIGLMEYGKPFGVQRFLKRAPEHTQELLMNRYQNRLSGREWALYLAFPASQYLLIYGWVIFLRTDFILRRVLMLLLALAICTAADALLFTAIRGMAQRSELKARNDLLARQIDRQNEHYAALTAQYENLRRIRHDISSHLYTMQLLLQEGQYDEAAAYSAEVTEACRFRSDLGACENPVVDAFLYSRTEELRAQGYTLQLQVCIPAETGIRNADMVVAFGNLLDNAAEACRDAGEKRLSLSARCG